MAPSLKNFLEKILLLTPRAYAKLLRLKSNWNLDKYLFLSLVQKEQVVIDGGANVGLYSVLFSRIVGSQGKVFSFEPTPPTFAQLEKTLLRSGAKNVKAHSFALGSKTERATIHLPEGVSGHAALEPHGEAWGNVTVEPYEVEVRRLDDWAEEIDLDRLDFMKLDLEGAEPLALEGAAQTLSKHLPSIHLELSPSFMKDFGCSVENLKETLEKIGYDTLLGFRDKHDLPQPLGDLLKNQPHELDCTLVCLQRAKHQKQIDRLAR